MKLTPIMMDTLLFVTDSLRKTGETRFHAALHEGSFRAIGAIIAKATRGPSFGDHIVSDFRKNLDALCRDGLLERVDKNLYTLTDRGLVVATQLNQRRETQE